MSKCDIWDITHREQTQLKLRILERYLPPWSQIVGNKFSEAYYIDCFAGRGRYHKDGLRDAVPGSPLIAYRIGKAVTEAKQKKGKIFKLHIIAIEADKGNRMDLLRFIGESGGGSDTDVSVLSGTFDALIPAVIREVGSAPAFFFIDPYGIKAIPRDALDAVVGRASTIQKTEIFLNYMTMGVKRLAGLQGLAEHEEEKIRLTAIKGLAHLDRLFGGSTWTKKEDGERLRHFAEAVLKRGFKTVLNFHVPYPDRSGTIYNLLFATNNPIGKKIMIDIFKKSLFEGTLFENKPFEVDYEL
jgi:three-Cys-motif partner protein